MHFYTNGIKTIKLKDTDEIPDGFYRGRTFNSNPWNKGQTKETNENVRKNTEAMRNTRMQNGTYESSWNKGLTKETNEILAQASQKISKSMLGNTPYNKGVPMKEESKKKLSEHMMGHTPWNKGLTKETNSSVLSSALKRKGMKMKPINWQEAKRKEYETRKKNKSWNKSQWEEDYFSYLIATYGEDNVKRQYFDEKRYPFQCDFYIPSEDLFIEYHGSWAHHTHPFDNENADDVALKEYWQSRADGGSKYYKGALYTWTDLDVRKLKLFRENKLNFQIIYPKSNLVINK